MNLTVLIVIVTGLISVIAFSNKSLFDRFKHWPYAEKRNGEYYRLLTSGFLHGSWIHLLINMFVFWQFGYIVEQEFNDIFGLPMSRVYFATLYLSTIIIADIPTLYKHSDQPSFASIGASGAVSGILFTYILFKPWAMLYLWGLLPIPGIVAAVGYLVYSSWASRNTSDRIDHDAHFYGAIYGMLFTIALKPSILSDFIDRLIQNIPL